MLFGPLGGRSRVNGGKPMRKLAKTIAPTGREITFDLDEIIVSKTDKAGRITYANDVFLRLAGYKEEEIIGAPHSVIRHPDMPRAVFKLLWDQLATGKEIFAYVVNLSRDGSHYWVYAHVTPSYDARGQVIGYHSNRRVPDRTVLEGTIMPLYNQILAEEKRHQDRRTALSSSFAMLESVWKDKGISYDDLILSL